MADTYDSLQVSIWRGGPDGGQFQEYETPAEESQTILDVVAWVQQHEDPTLTYRYACRVGMCGSCAMMVNGVPRWTCRTHVKRATDDGRIRIEPLRNLPVLKDLATDMDPFFEKWVAAEGVFHPEKSREDGVQEILPTDPDRLTADAGIECINCAVCYAACDVVAAQPDYLGPAALNRAWTLLNDAKDAGRDAVLDAVSASAGCHNCHSMGNCTNFCPNELDPMTAIAGLKRATARSFFGRRR